LIHPATAETHSWKTRLFMLGRVVRPEIQ
jgi:hypothetical protein